MEEGCLRDVPHKSGLHCTSSVLSNSTAFFRSATVQQGRSGVLAGAGACWDGSRADWP